MRNDIVIEARKMLGVPFRHQGRSEYGVDCGGLVVVVLEKLGVSVKDARGYGRQPYAGMLQKMLDSQFARVTAPEPGDLLLMRFRREPQHIAIFSGDTIIHAYSSVGKVVEHRFDDRWRSRVVSIYRVEDEPWQS